MAGLPGRPAPGTTVQPDGSADGRRNRRRAGGLPLPMANPPTGSGSAGPAGRGQTRQRETRRVFAVALVISVLLHLAVGLTVQFRYVLDPPGAPITYVPPGAPDHGTTVHNIVEAEGDVAPIEAQVPARRDAPPSFVAPSGAAEAVIAPREGAERRDIEPIGDRLRPRLGHTQVWTDPDVTPTQDEVVRRRVAERLAEYNDSVAAEAERERRARDWTVRDGSGRRWGIGPDGRLVLGGVTIPGQIAATTPGWRDEAGGTSRAIRWQEIQDQANRELVREMFDERVRIVRERRNAERDSARATGGV
jgi:hypothetical protein